MKHFTITIQVLYIITLTSSSLLQNKQICHSDHCRRVLTATGDLLK